MLFSDVVVFAHILSLAVGLGCSVRLDFRLFAKRHGTLSDADFEDISQSHTYITLALLGLWVTGLVLIGLRTGYQLENFSPKLWAKLFIVIVLTLNAVAIDKFVLPILRKNKGLPLMDLEFRLVLPMAFAAATSSICWLTALALGSSKFLKVQTWDFIAPMLALEFFLGFTIAFLVTLTFRMQQRRAKQIDDRKT